MRLLSIGEIVAFHRRIVASTGGASGIRDRVELDAPVDEQERVMLRLAAGDSSREELTDWLGGETRARG